MQAQSDNSNNYQKQNAHLKYGNSLHFKYPFWLQNPHGAAVYDNIIAV